MATPADDSSPSAPPRAASPSGDAALPNIDAESPQKDPVKKVNYTIEALPCVNCGTRTIWRRDDVGNNICNACGAFQSFFPCTCHAPSYLAYRVVWSYPGKLSFFLAERTHITRFLFLFHFLVLCLLHPVRIAFSSDKDIGPAALDLDVMSSEVNDS
ncbi:hypothetical protein AZE42_04969 [Rhizopogon vesiculosus]|uniref:GATA-type domain-containing protein n=1 Tax=Rhizopogon vesiculosus TaxID=180088 RepID=A0A1J8QCS6_9AGAM|nr:hypothetical protein AZE42_04969 [Rhizopogon vesiculosus]